MINKNLSFLLRTGQAKFKRKSEHKDTDQEEANQYKTLTKESSSANIGEYYKWDNVLLKCVPEEIQCLCKGCFFESQDGSCIQGANLDCSSKYYILKKIKNLKTE